MSPIIRIGTSGWHYNEWHRLFYPPETKGYEELRYYSTQFHTVENNSSFYKIARISTYETWNRMTPEDFIFSVKLHKSITHIYRLHLTEEVITNTKHILESLQVLGPKL